MRTRKEGQRRGFRVYELEMVYYVGQAASIDWDTTARTVKVESTQTSSCLVGNSGRDLGKVERLKDSIIFTYVKRKSETYFARKTQSFKNLVELFKKPYIEAAM